MVVASGIVGLVVRRRRHRTVGVAAVALVALVDIAGSYLPRSAAELVEIDRTVGLRASMGARASLGVAAVAVALLVRGVWRGQRRAWGAAVAGSAASAGLQVLRDASWQAAAVCGVVAVGLVADYRSYRVPGRAVRAPWLVVPAAAIAALAFGAFGWAEHGDGLPDLSFAGRARVVARGMLFLPPGVTGTTRAGRAFLDVLPVGGAAVAVVGAASLFVLAGPDRRRAGARVAPARFVAEHGRTSAAPLAALPGNELIVLGDSTVVGVRIFAGVSVAVGPPISVDGDEQRDLAAFVSLCEQWGTIPAVVDAGPATAAAGARVGFAPLKIGEEAFVDLASFSLAGKARANVRHSATRAERDGITVLRYDAASRTPALDGELAAISDAWLATKHGPELGFTLGRFDPGRLVAQHVYAALDASGSAVAFVTWLPYERRRGAVLDLMRRGADAPPGVMELLIARSLEDLRARGVERASLGGVPLASTGDRVGALDRALGWVYEHGGTMYEAKGLFAFKRKFDPRWEPMFLLYPTGADLPRIAAAIGRAFLPPGRAALTGWLPRRRR